MDAQMGAIKTTLPVALSLPGAYQTGAPRRSPNATAAKRDGARRERAYRRRDTLNDNTAKNRATPTPAPRSGMTERFAACDSAGFVDQRPTTRLD